MNDGVSRPDCVNANGTPKYRYESKAKAEAQARKTGKTRLNDGPNHAYLCPTCGAFHVGHLHELEMPKPKRVRT